jgi:hypothetical protein
MTGPALPPPADLPQLAELDARAPIDVSSGPEAIRVLAERIGAGLLPETYVTDGRVVHVEEISGSAVAAAGDEDALLPMAPAVLGPAGLARLLAEHTYTYRQRSRRDGKGAAETYREECTPPAGVLAAVLAARTWPKLPPLYGIVGAPVLRPGSGTLLQEPGYDPATGLYLARRVSLPRIPDRPTTAQVAAARAFLLDVLLADFPWVSAADQANYLALMLTPILRPYLRCLTPFGIVTATMPASGKTILTAGVGMLYGQRVLTWTDSDEELRKAVTSVLADPVGAVVFDNLTEGAVINSAVLARLITEKTWADRRLGTNTTATLANDRLWLATGNNLSVGGDMATRSVLVRLDPDMPRPEERRGFAIPDLDGWILRPANQAEVLRHLLVLVLDWTAAGAPRTTGTAMRQFTPWAEALAGLLAHHDIDGFLANREEIREIDEDAATWAAFLRRWHDQFPAGTWTTAVELRQQADPVATGPGQPVVDPWLGTFPTDARGNLPSAKSLGRMLRGQVGRWRGEHVLRARRDTHTKINTYTVEWRQP